MTTPARLAADLILYNGRIATLDPRRPEAEAVATLGTHIVAVGDSASVRQLGDSFTREIDLHGRRVVPGLMDNHTHYLLAGLDAPEVGAKANIAHARSIAAILSELENKLANTPPGEWVATSCMYRGALAEGRFPDRFDLDPISPDNPVYLFQSGKNVIVNSYALRLAGITRDTSDPTDPEGHIVRDPHGEPTGHLIAGAADMARLRWWGGLGLPPKKWDFLYFPQQTMVAALEAQGRIYTACGVVAVRDMGVSPDELEAYLVAHREGRLPVRVDLIIGLPARYLSIAEVEQRLRQYFGPRQGIGDDWVRIGGLKMVVQNDGWWAYSPEKVRAMLGEANRRGWTIAIHATTGTAADATALVLDTLEEANREVPIGGRRFSYEHGLGLLEPRDYLRVRDLGMTIAANPLLCYFGAARSLTMHETMSRVRIAKHAHGSPHERAVRDWGMPLKDWIDAGILVTGGTDNPAVVYDPDHPLLGMYSAISGETLAGVLLPGQQVAPAQALRMWTLDNARAVFQEDRRGSIEIGKLADMVVLSDDILSSEVERIKDVVVVATIVGGAVVYER